MVDKVKRMSRSDQKRAFFTLFALFVAAIIIVPVASAENVTTPYITIDPIGNHTIDEIFFIHGTTNLPAHETLILQIYTTNFNPGGAGSGYRSDNISVQPGENGVNTWSCNATTSLWETWLGPVPDAVPGQYLVGVYSPLVPVGPEQLFYILPSGTIIPRGTTVPAATFGYIRNTSGTAPLFVQFVDTSAGGPTSWLWSFGDGSTSTSQNPSHIYTSAGTYRVTLTAINAAGSNTTSEPGVISVNTLPASPPQTPVFPHASPVASFAYTTTGSSGLLVKFEDTSTNSPSAWYWTFGDGSTSASQNLSHTYTSAGTFTVTLTAINAAGSNTTSVSLNLPAGDESTQSLLVPPSTTQAASLPAAMTVTVLAAMVILSSLYRRKT